ncbi:hypothetical protein HGRIS_006687 [Hohenbuehelia grisea]|uniref:Uncharacterized protein n=1 Tax=Hohenbuehelia grisea TaxID=104357 RepID=A0ABR3J9P8_9AGAR
MKDILYLNAEKETKTDEDAGTPNVTKDAKPKQLNDIHYQVDASTPHGKLLFELYDVIDYKLDPLARIEVRLRRHIRNVIDSGEVPLTSFPTLDRKDHDDHMEWVHIRAKLEAVLQSSIYKDVKSDDTTWNNDEEFEGDEDRQTMVAFADEEEDEEVDGHTRTQDQDRRQEYRNRNRDPALRTAATKAALQQLAKYDDDMRGRYEKAALEKFLQKDNKKPQDRFFRSPSPRPQKRRRL